MSILRTACLAAALALVTGPGVAQESPSPTAAQSPPLGLRGCMLPAAPSPEAPCHHQMGRLGLDGAEAVTDLPLPAAEPLQIALFDLGGALLISPGERAAVAWSEPATAVAAAGEAAQQDDVEVTGSIAPDRSPQ